MRIIGAIIALTLVASLGLAGASCVPTGPVPPAPAEEVLTGTVEVHVTDAPPDANVTSINVTVSGIEIHKAVAEQEQEQQGEGNGQIQQEEQAGQPGQQQGEWIPIEITGEKTFDLLLIKGLDELLATDEVDAGKYTQVRVTIDKVEVALGDNNPEEVKVPSGELKFVRPFDVVAGETTVIFLDFDADKSVTVTGAGKVIVKPVVKLTIQQGNATGPDGGPARVSEEESQEIARDYLIDSPTFKFDGIADSLELTATNTLRSPYSWEFVYEFESAHAGYGDRTGEVVLEVITPHTAGITVKRGEVTSAIMDEKWDMMKQELLSEE